MNDTSPAVPAIFRDEFLVPPTAIDTNGHVNNVVFVQWMQDAATRHFASAGCAEAMRQANATWVVRSHSVEFLAPAFAGDRLQVSTWVVTFSRVRSLRRYEFARPSDARLLVRGETDWVLINATTGKPCAIPESIQRAFVPGENNRK